jgi:thioredoxin
MKVDELAVVGGWPHTRATLRRWNATPWRVLGTWALGSLAVTVALLAMTWVAASVRVPDPSPHSYPGLTRPAELTDFLYVLRRNFTVLALHALACVAGFIAGWTPPGEAPTRVQKHAAPAAILFVTAATLFSLITQAQALGGMTADLAALLGIEPFELLAALAPHALPELFAVFLPLAAWTIASRRGAWSELLAATIATTVLAAPLVLLAAAVETWVSRRGCCSPSSASYTLYSDTTAEELMAGTITDVTDTSFQAEVLENETPVLVDFWAPWCGPCRLVAPALEEIASERDDVRIVKLNTDDNQETAVNYQVLAIPTMILFRGGQEVKRIQGAMPKKRIEAELEPALA